VKASWRSNAAGSKVFSPAQDNEAFSMSVARELSKAVAFALGLMYIKEDEAA
jgi:hypothetical protein